MGCKARHATKVIKIQLRGFLLISYFHLIEFQLVTFDCKEEERLNEFHGVYLFSNL